MHVPHAPLNVPSTAAARSAHSHSKRAFPDAHASRRQRRRPPHRSSRPGPNRRSRLRRRRRRPPRRARPRAHAGRRRQRVRSAAAQAARRRRDRCRSSAAPRSCIRSSRCLAAAATGLSPDTPADIARHAVAHAAPIRMETMRIDAFMRMTPASFSWKRDGRPVSAARRRSSCAGSASARAASSPSGYPARRRARSSRPRRPFRCAYPRPSFRA